MKKVSLVLTLMALLALPVHGQLLSNAIRNSVEKFTPGKVTFKDGSEMPYRWIVIPGDGDDKLTVSEDPKHKKKEKIDAAEVVSVTLWSEEFPDSMSTLYYICRQIAASFTLFPGSNARLGISYRVQRVGRYLPLLPYLLN